MDEKGYVQFQCNWSEAPPLAEAQITKLNLLRDKLYGAGLVGVDSNGIGFGNVSIRLGDSCQFVISGTQTGSHATLGPEHYATVTRFDIAQNTVWATGPCGPSSEAMSHAVCYQACDEIQVIAHVHNHGMWEELLEKLPTTHQQAQAGTPAMAYAIERLFGRSDLTQQKLLVMAGHQDGVIAFGADCQEVVEIFRRHGPQLRLVP